MHLYVLFLNGKRQEIGVEKHFTIQDLIRNLLLKDKELKNKQFSLLIDKEKRIITKDQYDMTLQQLGIEKEDYLTIVLDEHLNQHDQKQKFEQQSIPNKNQQQQIIHSSQKFTGVNNNIQTQQLSEQINNTPSLQ